MKYLLLCLCALAPLARASEPAIVEKARAYLGSESALNSVKSVHMIGKLTSVSSKDPSKPRVADVDIVFNAPWQECITVIYPDRLLHTALDNYEAWQQEQSPLDPGQTAINPRKNSQLTLLTTEQTKVLRADTWENLSFYRGIESSGGALLDMGPATIDGIACEKVAFIHSPTNVYSRYFDLATGRLVYSETVGGAKIREQGELKSGGIRFPKSIVTVERSQDGAETTTTYTFDKVTLNESFPSSLFAVPLLQPLTLWNGPAGAAAGDTAGVKMPAAPASAKH